MKAYRFYSDPGHGWLAVKRAELHRLGIYGKITPYSYQKGNTVYLEEDCDASLFVNAKEARGEKIEVIAKITDKRSVIRSYHHFDRLQPFA